MLSTRVAILATVGLTLIACTDRTNSNPLAPDAQPRQDQSLAARASDPNEFRQAIEGHATLVPTATSNLEQKYEVEAKQILGQPAKGQFEYKGASAGGFRVHGSVYCFMVQGNLARVAARIEQSDNRAYPVGSYLIWAFADQDQVPQHHPDISTEPQHADQSLATFHCAIGVSTGLFYPVQGNLEVHPEFNEH